MDTLYENSETGCCLRFQPEPWDEKEVTWEDKLFLKDRVRCFLHIPLNFGKVIVRAMEAIKSATMNAATLLRMQEDIGSVEPGKYADIVAVEGDPLQDISVLERISFVMKGGEVVR